MSKDVRTGHDRDARFVEVSVSELKAAAGRVPELAYLRVADDIAARIGSGELTPRTRLRAERELADYYRLAYGTIRRAMKELRARGLVVSVQGRGTFAAASGTARRQGDVPY